MSDVLEVSYVFHRNDVGRLQTVTVDIKRMHSVDIISFGIEIYISYFQNIKSLYKKNSPKKSSISVWGICLICLNIVTAMQLIIIKCTCLYSSINTKTEREKYIMGKPGEKIDLYPLFD